MDNLIIDTDENIDFRPNMSDHPMFHGYSEALDSTIAPMAPVYFYGITNKSLISSIISDISECMTPYAVTFTYPDISTNWHKICISDKTGKRINKKMTTNIEDMPFDFQIEKLQNDIAGWCRDLDKFLPKYSAIKQIAVYFEKTKIGRIHGHGIITMNNNYSVAVSQAMSMLWVKRSKGSFRSMHKNKGKYTDNAFDKCNDIKKWIQYISKENPTFQFPIDRTSFTQYVKAQRVKVSEYIDDSLLINDKYISQENIEEKKTYFFFPKSTIIDENQLTGILTRNTSKPNLMKKMIKNDNFSSKISVNFD